MRVQSVVPRVAPNYYGPIRKATYLIQTFLPQQPLQQHWYNTVTFDLAHYFGSTAGPFTAIMRGSPSRKCWS